jgi:hypothetical protein
LIPPRYRTIGAAAVLGGVNAYITNRLFHVAYTRQMGSIEAAFIGLARYIRDHFPHFTWFPLWYGGIPFADAYPPLLHFLVAGVSAVGASPGLAYHIVTGAFYALGPVLLFLVALRLGANRPAAFLAALGYSLISPSCWLIPRVRAETGGLLGPRRLVTMVRLGEGPHVASLVFLLLAIWLLDRALEKRRPMDYVVAGFAFAATVLTNWIGAVALALAVTAYLLAGVQKSWRTACLRTGAIAIFAYVVAMPWATPSTLTTISRNAPLLVGYHSSGRPLALFLVSLPLAAWILKRCGLIPQLRFGVLLTYSMAAMALSEYWLARPLLPQSARYHLEMDLALWLAAALALSQVRPSEWMRRKSVWITAALAILAIPLIWRQQRQARGIEAPIAIESTTEYKVAHWLDEHMPGRRVFAPGSISFWMTAFSDTPMLVGGFDNGIRNPLLWTVNYQLLAGDKTAVALAWLKAYGCDAIVGNDPASAEVFHSYKHPERLHSLPELWRDGPEVIYAVPHRGSLAHALPAEDLVHDVPAPYDPKSLAPYLAALDNPSLPEAAFRWLDPSHAEIRANLRPDYLLSVQVSWDSGWRATVEGSRRRVWGDKLGQLVVEPRCAGPCLVELNYTGGNEWQLARWVSILSLVGGIFIACRPLWPPARRRPWKGR